MTRERWEPGAVPALRIAVVAAERHQGFREALARQLATGVGIVVVAAVDDLEAAGHALRRRRGDALVVDLRMLTETRIALGPIAVSTAVVALGSAADAGHESARHGAHRYVCKHRAHEQLVPAVRAAWAAVTP